MIKTFKGIDSNGIVSRLRGNKQPSEVMPDWLGGWWEAKFPNGLGANVNRSTDISATSGIQKIGIDGVYDSSFNPGNLFDETPAMSVVQSDGKIVVAGMFKALNNAGSYIQRARICRLESSGALDTSFTSPFSTTSGALITNAPVRLLLGTTGGVDVDRTYIIGNMTAPTGTRFGIIRLNTNGSIDTTYPTGAGTITFNQPPSDGIYLSDGKIVVCGSFTTVTINGVVTNTSGVVVLNTDGTLNRNLASGLITVASSTRIYKCNVSGGTYMLTGDISATILGSTRRSIIKIMEDPSVSTSLIIDTTFLAPTTSSYQFPSGVIGVLSDDRILFAMGTLYGGTTIPRICRLNTNGTIDGTYAAGTGFNDLCTSITVLSDGTSIITGLFTSYNGTPCQGIIRLNASGTVFSSFSLASVYNEAIGDLTLSSSGTTCFIVGGFRTTRTSRVIPSLGTVVNNLRSPTYTDHFGPAGFTKMHSASPHKVDSAGNGSNVPCFYVNNINQLTKSLSSTLNRTQILSALGKTNQTNSPFTMILCASVWFNSSGDAPFMAFLDSTSAFPNSTMNVVGPGVRHGGTFIALASISGADRSTMPTGGIVGVATLETTDPSTWVKHFVVFSLRTDTAGQGILKEHIRGLSTVPVSVTPPPTTSPIIFFGAINGSNLRIPSGDFHGASYWPTDIGEANTELVANYFISQYKR